jgi:hypothetical protein
VSSDNSPNGVNQPTARHSGNTANTASGHAKGRHCAGAEGNQGLFRRALEALITEERSKQHHVLADRLAAHLQLNGHSKTTAPITPVSLNGAACFPHLLRPQP